MFMARCGDGQKQELAAYKERVKGKHKSIHKAFNYVDAYYYEHPKPNEFSVI